MKKVLMSKVGREVTSLCIGTSPLGSAMTQVYGAEVDDAKAYATVEAAFASPIRFIDTSNGYGESERRIGDVVRRDGLPRDYVIATKADPDGRDFSGARVRASFQESVDRLGLSRFDVYYIHDPDLFDFGYLTAPGAAVDAMLALRDEGLVGGIGVAGGDLDTMRRFVDLGVFDVVLNHNRYTLLDRSADVLIEHTLSTGAAFINAAPYASGLLAKGTNATYQYGAPSDAVQQGVRRLLAICADFGVELAALALQFSTQDPRITSTVVGVSKPERIGELVANDDLTIPAEIWPAVEAALDEIN